MRILQDSLRHQLPLVRIGRQLRVARAIEGVGARVIVYDMDSMPLGSALQALGRHLDARGQDTAIGIAKAGILRQHRPLRDRNVLVPMTANGSSCRNARHGTSLDAWLDANYYDANARQVKRDRAQTARKEVSCNDSPSISTARGMTRRTRQTFSGSSHSPRTARTRNLTI